MKLSVRLREVRHQLRLRQRELAAKIGVSESRVNSIENGKVQKLTPQEVEAIVGLGFNRYWILSGEGSIFAETKSDLNELRKMLKDTGSAPALRHHNSEAEFTSAERDAPALRHHKSEAEFTSAERDAPLQPGKVAATEPQPIPYYRNVTPSAGHGLEIYNEEPDGEIKTLVEAYGISESQAKNIAIMYVSGYSMSPKLENGDGLLVNIKNTALTGEYMYVVRWRESLLVKIVQRLKNGVRLISINPNFAPIDLVEEECDDLQIIGRVVGTFAKM